MATNKNFAKKYDLLKMTVFDKKAQEFLKNSYIYTYLRHLIDLNIIDIDDFNIIKNNLISYAENICKVIAFDKNLFVARNLNL